MTNGQNNSRRGSMLIAVLVCLGVATTIILASVKMSILHRQQLRQDLQMEQTKWLLDASVRAGIAKAKQQADYQGETIEFTTPLSTSLGYPNATVELSAEPDDQQENIRLRVTASLENEVSFKSTKRSATILIDKATNE